MNSSTASKVLWQPPQWQRFGPYHRAAQPPQLRGMFSTGTLGTGAE